jgi:hypothetical protein
MSIQPNRVLARIVEQVDASDWPSLESRIVVSTNQSGWFRIYTEQVHPRYATPIHFWVHALREELTARAQREDLVGAGGRALCRPQSPEDWRAELAGARLPGEIDAQTTIHRMLESDCRRSSVAWIGEWMIAHFWGHGPAESWRQRVLE